ncbi:hypothetical protein AVEN_210748-1 [Araneus ventricosus]|uniref:Uncharacterized protein n=1 Tax=Araneus ventricosus TaxID=182803 RepID=A0A4Y2S130_ARAVE|nr:hypothetical protein AVEN_210748-1 [Araneus ventricosus]
MVSARKKSCSKLNGGGRFGLVVRCWIWSRRIQGSKPNSTNPSRIGPVTRQIIRRWSNILPLVWCRSLERGCQLRCRPPHLTGAQNDEVRPKIALVWLQNGTSIITKWRVIVKDSLRHNLASSIEYGKN